MKKYLALGIVAMFMVSGASAALNPDNWYIPDNDRWTEHDKGSDARIQFWCDSDSNCGTQDSAEVTLCGQSSSDMDITETADDGSYFDVYLDTSQCDMENSASTDKTVTLEDGGNSNEFTVTVEADGGTYWDTSRDWSSIHPNGQDFNEAPEHANFLHYRMQLTMANSVTDARIVNSRGGVKGEKWVLNNGEDYSFTSADQCLLFVEEADVVGDDQGFTLYDIGTTWSSGDYPTKKSPYTEKNDAESVYNKLFDNKGFTPSQNGFGYYHDGTETGLINFEETGSSYEGSLKGELVCGYNRYDYGPAGWSQCNSGDEGERVYESKNRDSTYWECQSSGEWEEKTVQEETTPEEDDDSDQRADSLSVRLDSPITDGDTATISWGYAQFGATVDSVSVNFQRYFNQNVYDTDSVGAESSFKTVSQESDCYSGECAVTFNLEVSDSAPTGNSATGIPGYQAEFNLETVREGGSRTLETVTKSFDVETTSDGGNEEPDEDNTETDGESGEDNTEALRSMSKVEVDSSTPTDVDLTWRIGKDNLPGNSMENDQLRDVATSPESWTISFTPFGSSAGIKGLMTAEEPAENDTAVSFRFDSTEYDTLLPNNEAGGADEPTSYLVEQDYNVKLNFQPEGGADQNNQDVYGVASKQLNVGVGGTNECRLPADYDLSKEGMLELVSETPEGSESTATVYPSTVRPSSSCSLLVFLREDDLSVLELSEMQDAVSNGNLYLQWGHDESKLNTVEYWHTPVTQVERTGTSRHTTFDSSENRYDSENILVVRTGMTDQAEKVTTGEVRDFSYEEYSLGSARVEDGGSHGYNIQGTEYPISIGCSENCADETTTDDTPDDGTTDGDTTDGEAEEGDEDEATEGTETTDGDTTTSNPDAVEYTWWGPEMERKYVNADQEGISACDGVDLSSDFESLQQCQLSIIENCRELGGGCYGRFLQLCDWLSLPDDYGYCPAPSEVPQTYKGDSE